MPAGERSVSSLRRLRSVDEGNNYWVLKKRILRYSKIN